MQITNQVGTLYSVLYVLLGTLLLPSLAGSTLAHASAAVALVLDLSSTSTPALNAYQEITASTPLHLGQKTRLTFLHYATCHMVTVTGGVLQVEADTYRLTGGKTEQDTRVDCPRHLHIGEHGQTGRQPHSDRHTVPLLPTFVLVGHNAEAYSALRVLQAGKIIMDVPIQERRVPWPRAIPPLSPDTIYEAILITTSADAPPARFTFMATRALSGQTLILVHGD
ncbi:MAG: hypothetical protein AB7N91_27030 [Candidatus Tectimicrobiota bacterium]